MKQRPLVFLASCVLALAGLSAGAASPSQAQRGKRPDPRVAALLNELNLKYETDKEGDYRLVMGLENNRSHLVIVESEVLREKGLEPFRTVRATAMISRGALPPAVRGRIQRANDESEGQNPWTILKYRDGSSAVEYISTVLVDCDAEDLSNEINTVAQEADAMELELTGQDEF